MDALKKHGEKLLLLILALGLAAAVVMGLAQIGDLQDPDALQLTAPPGGATLQVDELDATLARLTDSPPTVEVAIGSFTPEERVICINETCRSLIPPDAEVCPFCDTAQTVGPRDTDGDGITDRQEITWGMNPNDADDVYLDPDGDGFPTLYEFENGTDPTDADSTPELIKFVRLQDVEESSIEFELRGTAKLGDDWTLQLFWKYPGEDRGTTAYVRTGRTFGRNGEFLAESFIEKRTLKDNRYVDESVAVIRSGRYEVKLGRTGDSRSGSMTDSTAILETIFGPDLELAVRVDETIEVGKKSYKVVDITRKAVVLQPDADQVPLPETVSIVPKTPEDEEALEKFRPAGGAGLDNGVEGQPMDGLFPDDFF